MQPGSLLATEKMKILHVMSELPCPADNGMRADMGDRLKAMSRLGCSVDVLVMKPKVPPEKRHLAEVREIAGSLAFIERRPVWKSVATIAPTFASRNYGLAEFPLAREYDVTIAEGEEVFPIFDNPLLRTGLRVLRVHNDESAYFRELARAQKHFLQKQFLRLEALRLLPYCRSAFRRVDSLWFISQVEHMRFVTAQPASAAKAVWLPPSIALGDLPRRNTAACKRVLFVGSLHITLNQEAVRWYLTNVHRHLFQIPGYELVVAGSTQGRAAAEQFAEEIRREERCTAYTNVDDLGSLYEQSVIFVNPMQRGAGVKLKSVHAIERGIPVVSTSVGNEGSGFADKDHVRVADTPAGFTAAVAGLLQNREEREQMALRAYDHFRQVYDCEANIGRLLTNVAPRKPEAATLPDVALSA